MAGAAVENGRKRPVKVGPVQPVGLLARIRKAQAEALRDLMFLLAGEQVLDCAGPCCFSRRAGHASRRRPRNAAISASSSLIRLGLESANILPRLRLFQRSTSRGSHPPSALEEVPQLIHEFEELLAEKRQQNPGMDGSGLKFETPGHGVYPETMTQAIRLDRRAGPSLRLCPGS